MHAQQRKRILTHAVTAHLSDDEHRALKSRADAENETLSQYARRELVQGVVISQQERRLLGFVVIGEEKVRLMLEAAQSGLDVRADEVRERIENEAILTAESVVERRLRILSPESVEVAA